MRPSAEHWLQQARQRIVGIYESPEPWIELGPGNHPVPGTMAVLGLETGWDANQDYRLPFKDGSIGCIWMHGFIDYVEDPVPLLRECARVLMPGIGLINIVVSHAMTELADSDVHKKSRYTERTFRNLLDNPHYDPPGGDIPLRVVTNYIMGTEWHNLCLFTQLMRAQ